MNLRHRHFALLIAATVSLGFVIGCRSDRSTEQNAEQPAVKPDAANTETHKEVGEASWYGPGFHGQETASGETFDQKKLTAAHPSLPMGTKATVTNLDNGKKVDVTINDRGPATKQDRAIDLSSGAANKLDMKQDGTAQVKIETKIARKKPVKRSKAKLASSR
ncbi:septal ring lytic transglycosylase RlpA family protein [Methylomonas sp. 2BW1-5-20]|uniref:septal ring lytic transglycosylase RlpA family protein n=1 Tax=Methylomonas sp. 2BW1-5-20 TaxID=3376686 RepID=UPI00404DB98D